MAIVKVQIPLFPHEITGPALVYEEDRKKTILQEIPVNVRKAIWDTHKGYFKATWVPDRVTYEIHEQTDDQPW